MMVMQQARDEITNPTPLEQLEFNDTADELQNSLSETLIQLAEITASGGTVGDHFLDDLAGQTSELVRRLVAYGTRNLDAQGNAHLQQALRDLMQEMSRLLESTVRFRF